MVKYAQFDGNGFPVAFYAPELWGYRTIPADEGLPEQPNPECNVPSDAIEISDEQWSEFLNNSGARKWSNGQVVECTPPPPSPALIVVPAVTLWERLSETEAEQVNAAMATQPFRTRQIFLTPNTFRSDHELWPLLVQMATELFGEARAAELLSQ